MLLLLRPRSHLSHDTLRLAASLLSGQGWHQAIHTRTPSDLLSRPESASSSSSLQLPSAAAQRCLQTSTSTSDSAEDDFYGGSNSGRPAAKGKSRFGSVKGFLNRQTAAPLVPPRPTSKTPGAPPPPPASRPGTAPPSSAPRPTSARPAPPPRAAAAAAAATAAPALAAAAAAAATARATEAAARASTFAQLLGLPPAPKPRSRASAAEPRLVPRAAAAPPPDPLARHIHPRYGFAAVGGVDPTLGAAPAAPGSAGELDSVAALEQSLDKVGAHPRVHPVTTFMPGQAYNPEDLNPYYRAPPTEFVRRSRNYMPSLEQVRLFADYKNAMFLEKFLTPAGRLLPRMATKLPKGIHRFVSKQVKVARNMALLPHEARLGKVHLKKLRQVEARAAGQLGCAPLTIV